MVLATVMALALTVLFIAATQMRPLLESMATTRVSNTVTRIVSEAVYEAIEKGELQYDCTRLDHIERAVRYINQRGLPRAA